MNYQEFRETQKYFSSEDGKIAYIDSGDSNKVIVLLHGVPTSGWLYRKMIPLLVSEGYRVIVPDMLGFGNSENPKDYEIYHENNHAKRLLALMDYLKINSWEHVFHDAGGLWTWELLKIAPQRISKLIILNTIIYAEGFQPPMKFGKNWITKTIMKLYTTKLLNNSLITKLFKQGANTKLDKTEFKGYKTPLLEGKVNAMYYFFSKTCHLIPNNKALLPKLNIPSIVIWGKNDPFLKWDPQAELVSKDLKINPENIHLLDGKHFIQETFYKEIVEIIANYK